MRKQGRGWCSPAQAWFTISAQHCQGRADRHWLQVSTVINKIAPGAVSALPNRVFCEDGMFCSDTVRDGGPELHMAAKHLYRGWCS